MKQRTMDEMIAYFIQKVDEMDIDRKYKMALLGMIAAIAYENKKQESSAGHEPERKTGRWEVFDAPWYKCSECGAVRENLSFMEHYCPNCGAKMENKA